MVRGRATVQPQRRKRVRSQSAPWGIALLPGRRRSTAILSVLLAACFALVGTFAPVSGQPVAAAAPLPECRYDDVATQHDEYNQWRTTLLDTIYKVQRSYVPPRLRSVGNAGIAGSGKVRRIVIDDLAALAAAARKAGNPLRVVSAHRSYGTQQTLYRREVNRYGVKRARSQVARPGHSEHQMGTTLDFGSGGTNKKGWHYSDWAQAPAGSWLKANGWRFGFVMSYPKRKRSLTCYRYEPWHWRYVGREMAAQVRESGLTLREYLWVNFH